MLSTSLSSLGSISGRTHVQFLHTTTTRLSQLSLTTTTSTPFKTTTIRMGGGPRTYPGGVSKWQWKRMQAKKAKQLLKARLARERQIYEMRKRAELKAAVSELERPWEVVEKAPTLFSVTADEQLKVLADRFQKPGGFDMWSDKDGPELFSSHDGIPSSRFFPKGVVHSVKPYGKIEKFDEGSSDFDVGWSPEDEEYQKREVQGQGVSDKHRKKISKFRKNYNGTDNSSESTIVGNVRSCGKDHAPRDNVKESKRRRWPNAREKAKESKKLIFDLTLQKDGSYEIQQDNRK